MSSRFHMAREQGTTSAGYPSFNNGLGAVIGTPEGSCAAMISAVSFALIMSLWWMAFHWALSGRSVSSRVKAHLREREAWIGGRGVVCLSIYMSPGRGFAPCSGVRPGPLDNISPSPHATTPPLPDALARLGHPIGSDQSAHQGTLYNR